MAGSWALTVTVVEALISWERKYGGKKKNKDINPLVILCGGVA
jgi:hypothetical protein